MKLHTVAMALQKMHDKSEFWIIAYSTSMNIEQRVSALENNLLGSHCRNGGPELGSWLVSLESGWVRTKLLVSESHYSIRSLPIALERETQPETELAILSASASGLGALGSESNHSARFPGRVYQMLSAWMAEHIHKGHLGTWAALLRTESLWPGRISLFIQH